MKKKLLISIYVATLFALPVQGMSQDGTGASDEAFFEADNSEFSQPADDEGSLRIRMAGVSARIGGLQEEILELKGRMQEGDYQFGKKVDERVSRSMSEVDRKIVSLQKKAESLETELLEMGKVVSENSRRLLLLEKYTGFEPSSVPAGDEKEKKVSETKGEMTESEHYNDAKALLDKGDLKASKESFDRFLAKFPGSENADNAQFWIGEIYYREEWYEKSILEYQKVIEKYAAGNKVPAAYLKQGLAFDKLGESANARLRYKELISKFPGTREAELAKKKLK